MLSRKHGLHGLVHRRLTGVEHGLVVFRIAVVDDLVIRA
jgi:hypothetical protein